MDSLDELLGISARLHRHLCPRQILGVRMGMMAGRLLDLALPQGQKRLLTIVETDGCFADGVSAATGCWVGRRTLRLEDLGKVAATFVDIRADRAVRIAPSAQARALAGQFALEAGNPWVACLIGYQRMPEDLLLSWQPVTLTVSPEVIMSRAGRRSVCEACGEEIINQREIVREGLVLCRACAGQAYYAPLEPRPAASNADSPTARQKPAIGRAAHIGREAHELHQPS